MTAILYYFVIAFWLFFSILPMRVLYLFSDLAFFPMYYLVRYRRKVVRKNLVNAFPEKSLDEIVRLEKRFYHSLCDYFVETMKFYGMSEKKVRKHISFTGIEAVENVLSKGSSVVVYMAHTFNWEYATSMPLFLKNNNTIIGQIYHPLENKYFDEFFLKLRGQYNSESISMASTLRRIIEIGKQGKQFVIGFIADQVPTWNSIHHWLTFFNQETPVFTGTEKIARRTNSAVFFLQFKRLKRGEYTAHFIPMAENAAELPELELTNMYYRILEDSIREAPELWLWTHNRWKRTRKKQKEREKRRAEAKRLKAEQQA